MLSNDRSLTGFVVTNDHLWDQLVAGSQEQDGHQIWTDPSVRVLTSDSARSPRQVRWYLETGNVVENLFVTCDRKDCIQITHLTTDKAKAEAAQAARDVALIQRDALPTLADLYRRGKARGLLSSRNHYH